MNESIHLVVYHNDPGTAQTLVSALSTQFGRVNLINHFEELRTAIRREHFDVLVLDVEEAAGGAVERHRMRLTALADLHREFPSLCIVATHRLADDGLWTDAMNQGAADVCEPRNDKVIQAVLRERFKYTAVAA